MIMTDRANFDAILLLTQRLGRGDNGGAKPLTLSEWNRLVVLLKDHDLEPQALLEPDGLSLLEEWNQAGIATERVSSLLARGAALAFAREKWSNAGIWAITRLDPEYPARLKERLAGQRPVVLFGCGPRANLDDGGLAIVGARNSDDEDLEFAKLLGAAAAKSDRAVISGGSRGVDQYAMSGALERDGRVIGVLSHGLLQWATSREMRSHADQLTLISPFNPDAGFSAGNAMSRNKYIYCLADAAVAVNSVEGKGGTWTGALECLKRQWTPVWLRAQGASGSGNRALVGKGARSLGDGDEDADADTLIEQIFTAPMAEVVEQRSLW